MGGLNFSKNQQLALLALVGLSLIGLAYGRLRGARSEAVRESGVTITEPGKGRGTEVIAPPGKASYPYDQPRSVVVHVAGRVKNPGVYTLKPGARIIDAIRAASGPTADANLDAINLAARAQDGDRILVPSKQPPAALPQLPTSRPPQTSASGRSASPEQELVNINTAGIEELDRLPGVGPVTAQKIIDYRNQIGQFTSIDQLDDIKGIGPKKLEKMRPFVRL